jgi:diguanylate cyclase (GGDEF)-like protein
MAKNISLFDNKLAQRILLSFVLAALFPIGVLGLFTYQQVREQLRDQASKSLYRSSKDYAMGLLGRLSLAENSLRLLASNIDKSGKDFRHFTLEHESKLEKPFSYLLLITQNGKKTPLIGNILSTPELTKQEIVDIGSGKTVIRPIIGTLLESSQIWMAVSLVEHNIDAGILLAELNPALIWEEDEESNTFWVFNTLGQLLFASKPRFELPAEIKARFPNTNSGQFIWASRDSTNYIGAYWQLALIDMFSAPNLMVIEVLPEAQAFAAFEQFSTIFPLVIVLAVLIVAYLSTKWIAKYLIPLERLKAATIKIAGGDFTSRVNFDSHDEFEDLADSFNEMTCKLRSQFNILSTMAEIDRQILSALDAEDIVGTALNRLPDILFCDLISIARINPETYYVSDILTRRTGKDTRTIKGSIQLSLQDVLDLLATQNGVIETDNRGKFSAYLYRIGVSGSWRYLIIPVVVNGILSSIICLGYLAPNKIPAEAKSVARDLGDRIAVALSNAAWEEKMYQQAHYDSLTGLPNRLVLNDRLTQELARARRDDTQLAVFIIDLDRFKNVNDSLGHAAGDELLIQVSQIFVNCVRETDLVVRVGGDEFVVVIPGLHSRNNPMLLVSAIAEKILASLRQTLLVAGRPMTFTASLGVALFPRDADNIQDLLMNADAAMYHAKNEGRANFRFYSSEMNATALENIKLEQELRNAIAKKELVIHYQPKVELTGRIVGAEALIRWRHSDLGMVSPAKFIPIAEQTGLIVEIGLWVFEQVCLWVKSCQAKGLAVFRVSINLSAIEFKCVDLVEKVADILAKIGVDPSLIELELTESVTIGNTKDCIEQMNKLKDLGLTLCMDDFGRGFSSFSYLRELPLDALKVDQSFISNLDSENSSQAIVRAILALADGLGMETVAEGVETEAQLEFLKNHECNIFQGYLFSRPVSAEDFLKLLVDNSLALKDAAN